ncbi:hypothetical protein AAY473_014476 [Plecturocebus cupreus]
MRAESRSVARLECSALWEVEPSRSQGQEIKSILANMLLGRLRQENHLNPGGGDFSELRLPHCTPAWETDPLVTICPLNIFAASGSKVCIFQSCLMYVKELSKARRSCHPSTLGGQEGGSRGQEVNTVLANMVKPFSIKNTKK